MVMRFKKLFSNKLKSFEVAGRFLVVRQYG